MALSRLEESLFQPIAPSPEEMGIAKLSAGKLASALTHTKDDFSFELGEETVAIPKSAAKMLLDILSNMAQGIPIALIPAHAELTTQEAADKLNVSRPFLVKLLEEKKIPFRKVGSHRRILFSDLVAYQDTTKKERLKILKELQKDAQENDMGY